MVGLIPVNPCLVKRWIAIPGVIEGGCFGGRFSVGYVQILIYEKYRAIYEINDCHIMLDELPYGDFVEIEGPYASNIRKMALQIGLDFESAVSAGYARIFENYNSKYGFPPSGLTFDALRGKKPSPEELNVRAAD